MSDAWTLVMDPGDRGQEWFEDILEDRPGQPPALMFRSPPVAIGTPSHSMGCT
jgi:hypothetical protein